MHPLRDERAGMRDEGEGMKGKLPFLECSYFIPHPLSLILALQ
jgi:hypothetical protein